MEFHFRNNHYNLLIIFVCMDLVFVFIHILHKFTGLLPDYIYNIEYDRGYAEMFQYFKELLIILFLLFLSIKKSKLIYFSWALLFSYLLFDDAFQIHERLGGLVIAPWMVDFFGRNSRFGMHFKDYAELSVSVFTASLYVIFIGLCYMSNKEPEREISRKLLFGVIMLAFFGIGLDMIHEHKWIQISPHWVRDIFGLAEDSGEMFIMSYIAWYVFNLRTHKMESDRLNEYG